MKNKIIVSVTLFTLGWIILSASSYGMGGFATMITLQYIGGIVIGLIFMSIGWFNLIIGSVHQDLSSAQPCKKNFGH